MAINLTPNVYAHWKLNESAGNNCADSSIHGRNGTRINMEDVDWVAGKLNNCLQFDGVNEYVNCGNIAGFERTDTFSLECWCKTGASGGGTMLSKIKSTPNYSGYWLYFHTGKIQFRLWSDPGQGTYIRTVNSYNDNEWHHVIATYDGSSLAAGLKIYIDGSIADTTIEIDNLTSSILVPNNFQINGANIYPFNGLLDEAVIYDKELNIDEVEFRWNGGAGTEDMASVPPTVPSNPDPNDTATGIAYNQDLDWDSTGDIFDIYFGTGSPPPLVESDHATSDWTIPYNLDSCTKYYWKIVAKNYWGEEAAGAEWDFTTGNEPPITPYDNSPLHNATGQNLNVTLSWDSEDYNPNDTVVYDIYFGTASSPPLVKSNHGSKSYTVSGLINDQNYYWKIVARDNASCGVHDTASPIWKFTTKSIVTGGYESFDPREAYRNQLASLWNVNKDCDGQEKCIYIEDSKGDRVYIPMYLSEEVKSEQLPALPFLELQIPPGGTTYEPQDIAASTRKMESYIVIHIYFTDTDNINRNEFAKKIKDRLHDLTRYYQSTTEGIVFMNIEDDGLEEETDGKRVVFHYIATLYCLYYDTCIEP